VLLLQLFCCSFPLLVFGKDLPARDVAVLGAEYFVLDQLGGAVVFGGVEVRQFLHELVHVVLGSGVDAPLAQGARGQPAGPEDFELHRGRLTMELSKTSFFLCCTPARPSPSSRYNSNSGKRSPTPKRFA